MLARFSSLPCLLAFISVASALESPLPNHDVQQQVWTVPITPGGPNVMVAGTVQQLLAKVTEINPNYEADFPSQALDPSQQRSDIDKRNYKDHLIGRYSCGYDFYGVVLGRVHDKHVQGGLVDYLDKVTGTPKLGPVSCSRVSCDSGQGIWWCNHDSREKTLGSFKVIADAAREVVKLCHGGKGEGAGQIELQDNWSVIYRGFAEC